MRINLMRGGDKTGDGKWRQEILLRERGKERAACRDRVCVFER
jgi:hypothetical protein